MPVDWLLWEAVSDWVAGIQAEFRLTGRLRGWRRCAAAPGAGVGAEQTGQAGALEAGVHLQRQDVGAGRGKGQAQQVGDVAGATRVEKMQWRDSGDGL